MALPNNVLQQVQTYQRSELAFLLNSFASINLSNKKFKDFENREANLGDTVTFDLPPQSIANQGLVVTFEPAAQRVQSLTASQSANVPFAFSAQQFIFNVRQYMEEFGKSSIYTLGSKIEADVNLNFISGVTNQNTNVLNTASGPYRFYASISGGALQPINSYGQLAQALANFRDYGTVYNDTRAIIPVTAAPGIINSGLNQFAMNRNNEDAMSWMLGNFDQCDWYQSNLLPIQNAGTVGNSAQTLTVISTNDPTGQNITQITLSGATVNDANAIKAGDLLQFNDGVSSQPNMRYNVFIGNVPSGQPVQVRATANATADGSGHVVISIFPALISANVIGQNLNNAIVAGMQMSAMPSHRAGIIWCGNALYLAMPQLPEEIPFPTANAVDRASGASIRSYYGSLFGQNQRGYVHDAIWGSVLVPEYSMRLCFPV
jgi:hypothetical protein